MLLECLRAVQSCSLPCQFLSEGYFRGTSQAKHWCSHLNHHTHICRQLHTSQRSAQQVGCQLCPSLVRLACGSEDTPCRADIPLYTHKITMPYKQDSSSVLPTEPGRAAHTPPCHPQRYHQLGWSLKTLMQKPTCLVLHC